MARIKRGADRNPFGRGSGVRMGRAPWRVPGTSISPAVFLRAIRLSVESVVLFSLRLCAAGYWCQRRLALSEDLPEGAKDRVEVRFRRPILLPGTVAFASAAGDDGIDFAVRDARKGTPHLDGRVEPLQTKQSKQTSGRKRAK